MATPSLSRHELPGAFGPLLVDVRTGDRQRPRPAVVFVHGFKGFKDWGMFPVAAERMARAGLTAVTFNLSGSGVDARGDFTLAGRFEVNTHAAEIHDLGVVLDGLPSGALGVAAPSSVVLVGHSRGGVPAIALATRGEVGGLVTWASISTVLRWDRQARERWRAEGHIDIVNARTGQVLPIGLPLLDEIEERGEGAIDVEQLASRVRVPWLIVHGTADETVAPADASRLAAASGAGQTTLHLVPGAGHTFGMVHPAVGTTPEFEDVLNRTLDWCARVAAR